MTNEDIHFTTLPFRTTSKRYFEVIFRQLFMQWWSVALLLFIILVGATCYDLRFGIIILMFLFIILPLILFMVYYNYALRPEAFYSVVEKSVTIHAQGIDCIYNEQCRKVLSWDDVQRVVFYYDAYHIYTGNHTYFYLSRNAFATAEEMKDFEQNYLPRYINKNEA